MKLPPRIFDRSQWLERVEKNVDDLVMLLSENERLSQSTRDMAADQLQDVLQMLRRAAF